MVASKLIVSSLQMLSCANLALKELTLNEKSSWDPVIPVTAAKSATAGSCHHWCSQYIPFGW